MRKLGYVRDVFDDRDRPAADLFGAAPPPAASASLRGHVVDVLDQHWDDCTANAIAQALRVRWSALGDEFPPLVSRRAIYRKARAAEGTLGVDAGCRPRVAFDALRKEGYGLEAYAPYDQGGPFDPLPPRLAQHAYDQAGQLTYHRVSEARAAREREIRAALASLVPLCLGVQIDQPFQNDPGPRWERRGANIGGHYVCAVGADDDGVLIVNSWGTDWGDAGFCTIAWRTILDYDTTTDVYVVDFAPETTEPR